MRIFRYLSTAFWAGFYINDGTTERLKISPFFLGVAIALPLLLMNTGLAMVVAATALAGAIGLAINPRFQRVIDGQDLLAQREESGIAQSRQLSRMSHAMTSASSTAFTDIMNRIYAICVKTDPDHPISERTKPWRLHGPHADRLYRLAITYGKLLVMRDAMRQRHGPDVDSSSDTGVTKDAVIHANIAKIKRQLDATPAEQGPLRRSLESRIALMESRLALRGNASHLLPMMDSELERIDEQVSLIEDQMAANVTPQVIGSQVDDIVIAADRMAMLMRDQVSAPDEDFLQRTSPISDPIPMPRRNSA